MWCRRHLSPLRKIINRFFRFLFKDCVEFVFLFRRIMPPRRGLIFHIPDSAAAPVADRLRLLIRILILPRRPVSCRFPFALSQQQVAEQESEQRHHCQHNINHISPLLSYVISFSFKTSVSVFILSQISPRNNYLSHPARYDDGDKRFLFLFAA